MLGRGVALAHDEKCAEVLARIPAMEAHTDTWTSLLLLQLLLLDHFQATPATGNRVQLLFGHSDWDMRASKFVHAILPM